MKKISAHFLVVSYIFLFANTLFSQGTAAREEVNLDEVYNQYGLTGEGVIYAMLDRGVDYRHPDFIDENGNTRIAYIFDMINNTGANAPNNPYGVGTIFAQEEINASLQTGGTPLSTDRGGHGTATTGIAAGNGTGTLDLAFQGVAPKATLIIVKLVQDAHPAFGNQPAQSSFYNPAYIPIALQFVSDKVAELNMPSVTLMNIGSVGGPTDGTSEICRTLEDFIAGGHTFVCGVGDDGGAANHASASIAEGETITLEVNKGQTGTLRFDLWYSEDDRFDVSVELPNGTVLGPYTSPQGPNVASDINLGSGVFYAHRGADVEFFGATSNTRELLIDFSGSNGLYKVNLKATSIGASGIFHATLNPSRHGSSSNYFSTYAVAGYNLNDFTTAPSVISPGDYVHNNSWTDINGVSRDITGEGESGEIWAGSSNGPTFDGRLGIDFVSPGEVLFGAYAPDSYYSNFDFNIVANSDRMYGIQNAVSAAAPLTTGVIALMLQLNPNLTPTEVKSILQSTARMDSFTGSVPNETFGYGKIDALAAITAVENSLGIAEIDIENNGPVFYPNPVSDKVQINSSKIPESIVIYNMQGQVIHQEYPKFAKNRIEMSNYPAGIYFTKVKIGEKSFTHKIIKKD